MYIPRILDQKLMAALANRKILFVLGARQVGKTTLLQNLLKKEDGNLLNLDLEVDKNRLLAAASLAPQEAIRTLGGGKILVIDEAHHLSEVGRITKGWYDAGISTKIILLGSSSLNLLDKAAESLVGRNEKLFLTPLLFEEILNIQSWYNPKFQKNIGQYFSGQIQALLFNQLVFGSYPEAYLSEKKEDYLINLISDYLLKDILHPNLIKSPETIKKLLLLLAYQVGNEVSVNELASSLGISRPTVEKYLGLLQRVFVIFALPSFSTNPRKEIAKGKKIYFWDTGVRNALLNEFSLSAFRSDIGSLWENWIIAEFAKRNLTFNLYQDLYFWRTKDGSEVDLIIKDKKGLNAYEVKWSAKKHVFKKSFFDRYKIKSKVIHQNNFFKFLLSSGGGN